MFAIVLPRVLPLLVFVAGAALTQETPVTFQGVGPVRIGMALSEVERVLGASLTVEPEVTPGCTYVYLASGPKEIAFMVSSGVIARMDVEARGFSTLSGAQVGDTEERIKALYRGRFIVTAHAYTDGHYITVRSGDRRFALVFETDGRLVTSFRIGRLPEVLWVEGCS